MLKEPGVQSVTTWIGSGVPRFYLPLDQIFPQSNVSQSILLPKDLAAREALRQRLPACWPGVPGGARPRQAAAQRAAGAYPVQFRVWAATRQVVRQWADEAKGGARQPEHARRQRQLEREQVKVLRLTGRPGQGPRAGRHQPGHRAGVAHHPVGQHHRPVPRGRQADRHRAAPAAGRAQRHHRPGQRLPAHGQRPGMPLTQIAKVGFGWEPGVMWREGRRLRHHRAGRRGRRRAGPDRHGAGVAAAAGAGRAHAARATHRVAGAWKKAARARAPSPPACR
jgi:multidrug efflux pump